MSDWRKTRTHWTAKQHRKGWRLGFSVTKLDTVWLPLWFRNAKDIETALRQGIVFIHMADCRPTYAKPLSVGDCIDQSKPFVITEAGSVRLSKTWGRVK